MAWQGRGDWGRRRGGPAAREGSGGKIWGDWRHVGLRQRAGLAQETGQRPGTSFGGANERPPRRARAASNGPRRSTGSEQRAASSEQRAANSERRTASPADAADTRAHGRRATAAQQRRQPSVPWPLRNRCWMRPCSPRAPRALGAHRVPHAAPAPASAEPTRTSQRPPPRDAGL